MSTEGGLAREVFIVSLKMVVESDIQWSGQLLNDFVIAPHLISSARRLMAFGGNVSV
jgi:hypothetical protein